MSTSAIIMMIIALVLVWGGLIASFLHLRGHPDSPDDGSADVDERAPSSYT